MRKTNSSKIYIVAKSAQTLDGKVATRSGESKWITSSLTRSYARKRRDLFDAVMVGITTVREDDPKLTGSGKKDLKKIVVDSTLKISSSARLFKKTPPGNCILATTKQASPKKIEFFKKRGVTVLICPQKRKKVNLKILCDKLQNYQITKLLIEGGPSIIGSALSDGLVDEMNIYIAPKIMGDDTAKSSIIGGRTHTLDDILKLKNVKNKKIGKDLLVIGNVYRNH